MISPHAWRQADVYFRQPGQHLGEPSPQLQARAEVQFDGSWLHLRLAPGSDDAVSVPAIAVDRVHWRDI